jgi:20S proteasome alpha/beta subunit
MTNSQKNEIRLIVRALNNALDDVVSDDRIDLRGVRQEEAILIRDLLAKSISSPVKISTPVKDEEE